MKKILIFLALIIIVILLLNVFSKKKSENPTSPEMTSGIVDFQAENGTYALKEPTTLSWEGRRPLIEGYLDSGVLNITKGSLKVADNQITSGSFTFDMKSIHVGSTGMGRGNDMLANHLKSDDFFSVEKYPEAYFTVTEVINGILIGDLTIKGITQPVQFPVTLSGENELHIIATTQLDRTLWDVKFGSGKFFDNLANQMIDDNFTVKIDITLTK
ncbi:MAG: YceI family protein [Candidatus Pacebacteria bacterium]|nr:YceI family protein [Candidatus Paceibacterota bacterium]